MAGANALQVTDSKELSLRATAFAAILRGPSGEEALGAAAGEDALPKALRRRMSAFDQGVARCVMGLAAASVDEEIVYASRVGNLGLTLDLLTQLVQRELLSPAKFSMSVHNAAAGAASQIAVNRGGHTAIAAGARTLSAGLTEAWGRIAAGSPSVIFVYSDAPLPGPYAPFDEPGIGVQFAARLAASEGPGTTAIDGRIGAEALARALAQTATQGAGAVTWRP